MVPLNNHYTGSEAISDAVFLQQTERTDAQRAAVAEHYGTVLAEHDGDER